MASYLRIPRTRASESIRAYAKRGFGPVHRLSVYVRGLPPGDRFIAAVLAVLVGITSLVSLIALERFFLITLPAHGGSLTEGVVGAPRFVNPLLALSDTDRDLTSLTYAGLMGSDVNGNLVPVLAESYRVSEDGLIYDFTIRESAIFQDGTPVTADDVVFTVQKAQDPALKSPARANWTNITVEVVDARTVRFTLPRPYAPFLEDATLGILPAHLWKDMTTQEFPFSSYTEQPIGAGPFKVVNVSRGGNGAISSYTLAAFDGYALGRPYLDSLKFSFYPDQAHLADALKAGKIESAYGVPSAQARKVPYSRVFGVFFNPDHDPLYADTTVRKALSLAIDRDAVVNEVLGGYAVPAIGPVPAGLGVPELPLPNAATHLDDARATLTEGGWAWNEESQSWRKGDRVLAVTLRTSNAPELRALATRIQADWQSLGIPVSVEYYAPSELTQNVIRRRDYGALLFGEVIGGYPDLFAFWSSTERADPGLNIADYADDDVDRLLEAARTEPDRAKAINDLAQANERIAADYPAAFTHTPTFVYALPTDIQGVALSSIAAPTDRLAGIRYWYRHTERVWPWFAKKRQQ